MTLNTWEIDLEFTDRFWSDRTWRDHPLFSNLESYATVDVEQNRFVLQFTPPPTENEQLLISMLLAPYR